MGISGIVVNRGGGGGIASGWALLDENAATAPKVSLLFICTYATLGTYDTYRTCFGFVRLGWRCCVETRQVFDILGLFYYQSYVFGVWRFVLM